MVKVIGRAPAKAILFGEHFVVWGAGAIACAIEPLNEIEVEGEEGGKNGFAYETALGSIFVDGAGKIEGENALLPAVEVYKQACIAWPELKARAIRAKVRKAWALKGVGNSASLAAALAAALAKLIGEMPGADRIFELSQAADKVAHGGSPSGIDASTVSRGGVNVMRKMFASPPSYKFERAEFSMPSGWVFVLADTYMREGVRANTAEQIGKFAKASGMGKKPDEAGEAERKEVTGEYDGLFSDAISALGGGDMEKVGRLMSQNHKMLLARNVSCERIEEAVAAALSAGAAGAKLTGAGGDGSAVLALCRKKDGEKVRGALENAGFPAYGFSICKKGADAV